MECVACHTTEVTGATCQVCWCGIDLCPGCVDGHVEKCEWARAMKYKPAKKKQKKEPFPKIGRQSSHYGRWA